MLNPRIEELVRRDPRYAPEAYEFVYDALSYAGRRARPRALPHPHPPPPGEEGKEGGRRRATNTCP